MRYVYRSYAVCALIYNNSPFEGAPWLVGGRYISHKTPLTQTGHQYQQIIAKNAEGLPTWHFQSWASWLCQAHHQQSHQRPHHGLASWPCLHQHQPPIEPQGRNHSHKANHTGLHAHRQGQSSVCVRQTQKQIDPQLYTQTYPGV